MFNIKCVVILCWSFVVINANAVDVSFIEPCYYKDAECLLKSAKKAFPYILNGFPDLGILSFNPMHVKEINGDSGDLKLKLENADITDFSKCEFITISRSDPTKLLVELVCPITITGDYVINGTMLFVPIDGEGPFKITLPKIKFIVSVNLKAIEKNGEKYYKFTGFDYSYDALEKVHYKLYNLYNGDRSKAEPIEAAMDQSWKEVINGIGNPFIQKIIALIVDAGSKLFSKVPSNKLEKLQ